MWKGIIIFVGWILLGLTVSGQVKHNLWTRFTLQTKLNDKWEAALEFQHRRQHPENDPLFSKPLMYSVRPWINYKMNPHFSLSVSPLAWYQQHPVLLTAHDLAKDPMQELRSTLAVSYQTGLTRELSFQSRVGVEYRDFSTGQHVLRTRLRTGLQYSFSNNVSLNAYNEIMVNPAGVAPGHFFDQDRQAISGVLKLNQAVTVEAGYMHVYRKLPAYDNVIQENNYFVQFNISLPAR